MHFIGKEERDTLNTPATIGTETLLKDVGQEHDGSDHCGALLDAEHSNGPSKVRRAKRAGLRVLRWRWE